MIKRMLKKNVPVRPTLKRPDHLHNPDDLKRFVHPTIKFEIGWQICMIQIICKKNVPGRPQRQRHWE